jgi:type II secretory pathway component PulF
VSRIFLSHSSANSAEAMALRDWLLGQGFDDLFLDLDPERGLKAGQKWQAELKRAAERCELVIFLVSPEWAAARTFLTGMGIVGVVVFMYFFLTRILIEQQFIQEILLRIPVLGAVRRNTAIARFSWSMEMMVKAGMNIRDSLRRALESTSNGAFLARRQKVDDDIIGGESVSKALDNARLFPDDFMEIITVAEESGSMDESFGHMARQYFDRAETAMRISAAIISWLIWACVALLVAFVVISFYVGYFRTVLSAGGIH